MKRYYNIPKITISHIEPIAGIADTTGLDCSIPDGWESEDQDD